MHYAETDHACATGLPGQHLPWLQGLRQQAEARFSTLGFPTTREEEWRYTPLAPPFEKARFTPPPAPANGLLNSALIERHRLADTYSLVFVDGQFSAAHSDLGGLPDAVQIMSIAEALEICPDRVEPCLQAAAGAEEHGLLAFTTAYFRDGAFLRIPDGVALEKPVHLLHIASAPEGLAVLRHGIALGRQARASVIETYAGDPDASYFTAAITRIDLADGAVLEHAKLQAESPRAYHFGHLSARQQPTSCLRQQHAAFGGRIARTELHSRLERGAECELNGLFLASGRRHLDTHTRLHHVEAHAISRESYRGIAAGRGRGVFAGRIVVDPQAQKTDAAMSNRNLLLSEDAEIDSKPQLEIHADDVKCAHGVTIGQLDAQAVFYLQSRGIDEPAARNMLTFAFANEMVEKIRHAGLRQQVRDTLLATLPQAGIREDWL